MFSPSHMYVLREAYSTKGKGPDSIHTRVMLGNVLPDFLVDYNLRQQAGRDFHVEVHNKVKAPDQIEYRINSQLQRGLAFHVMGDNYSRVGTYWRTNGDGEGFLKALEPEVDIDGLELGKEEGKFRRKVLQAGLDILVLRDCREEMVHLMVEAMDYLGKHKQQIEKYLVRLTEVPEKHMQRRFSDLLFRYSPGVVQLQTSEPIRAYSPVRVVDNYGDFNGSPEFVEKVRNHPAFKVVLENMKLLEKDWKQHLRDAAEHIMTSPVGDKV